MNKIYEWISCPYFGFVVFINSLVISRAALRCKTRVTKNKKSADSRAKGATESASVFATFAFFCQRDPCPSAFIRGSILVAAMPRWVFRGSTTSSPWA
ncbi:hypothetical protein [Pontiella sulfatireligans]|uniref:hypothetical protein n=1 Tax=Pontiella sulfatireligans TaxID=2750658 RepID=UPI00109C7FE8|nr:hypothetical protein [Pontiella sulfatireligans]